MHGVNQVLNAAALTYLAAFMGAALNLLAVLSRRN
jgi:Zn-dependent membrane protease YugP